MRNKGNGYLLAHILICFGIASLLLLTTVQSFTRGLALHSRVEAQLRALQLAESVGVSVAENADGVGTVNNASLQVRRLCTPFELATGIEIVEVQVNEAKGNGRIISNLLYLQRAE